MVNYVKPGGAEHNFNVKYQQNSFTILYSSFKALVIVFFTFFPIFHTQNTLDMEPYAKISKLL